MEHSQTRRINPSANERRGKSKSNQDKVPTGSFTKLSHFISDALLLHWNSATLSAHLAMRFVVSFLSGWKNQKKKRNQLCVFTEGFAYLSLFSDIDRLLVLRAMVLPRSTSPQASDLRTNAFMVLSTCSTSVFHNCIAIYCVSTRCLE